MFFIVFIVVHFIAMLATILEFLESLLEDLECVLEPVVDPAAMQNAWKDGIFPLFLYDFILDHVPFGHVEHTYLMHANDFIGVEKTHNTVVVD